jgi:hypothetical protein
LDDKEGGAFDENEMEFYNTCTYEYWIVLSLKR